MHKFCPTIIVCIWVCMLWALLKTSTEAVSPQPKKCPFDGSTGETL